MTLGVAAEVSDSGTLDDLRRTLQVIGSVDGVLLLLPLLLLTAAGFPGGHEACGWTQQRFASYCVGSLSCLWFSLIVAAAQLLVLNAARGERGAMFASRLRMHVIVPVLGACAGSGLGILSLLGYMALSFGDCSAGLNGGLGVVVLLAYLLAALYAVLLKSGELGFVLPSKGRSCPAAVTTTACSGREAGRGAEDAEVKALVLDVLLPVEPTLNGGSHVGALAPSSEALTSDEGDPCQRGGARAARASSSGRDSDACSPRSRDAGSTGGVVCKMLSSEESPVSPFSYVPRSPRGSSANAATREVVQHPFRVQQDGFCPIGAVDPGFSAPIGDEFIHSEDLELPPVPPVPPSPRKRPVSPSTGDMPFAEDDSMDAETASTQAKEILVGGRKKQNKMKRSLTAPEVNRPPPSPVPERAEGMEFGDGEVEEQSYDEYQQSPTNLGSPRHDESDEDPLEGTDRFEAIFAERHRTKRGSYEQIDNGERGPERSPSGILVTAKKMSVKPKLSVAFNDMPSVEDVPRTEPPRAPAPSQRSTYREKNSQGRASLSVPSRGSASTATQNHGGRDRSKSRRGSNDMLTEEDTELQELQEPTRSDSLKDDEVHFYKMSPINFSTLNYGKSISGDGDGSSDEDSDEENDSGEEYWEPAEHIEVPIWLLERLKGEKADSGGGDASEQSGGAADATGGGGTGETDGAEGNVDLNRSSNNGLCGIAEEDSEDDEDNPNRKFRQQVLDQAKSSGSGPPTIPASTFWKIPMPTRKNTLANMRGDTATRDEGGLESEETDDEESEEGLKNPRDEVGNAEGSGSRRSSTSSTSSRSVPARKVKSDPVAPIVNVMAASDDSASMKMPTVTTDSGMSAALLPSRKGVRRSVLGVFSDDKAKAPGLYALPKGKNDQGKPQQGEVVELKRGSLVMSTDMLSTILKGKVDEDRYNDIRSDAQDQQDTEVVLPFFSPAQRNQFRQCQCKKDPVTGFVIHTCMTPSATMTENTEAFQSYVCSEWGTRAHSRRQSAGPSRAKSRRSSNEKLAKLTEEETDSAEPTPSPSIAQPKKKTGRIRNASVLAIVGQAGPSPAKKGTDEPGEAGQSRQGNLAGIADDEEQGDENELVVSFQNIKEGEISTGRGSFDATDSPLAKLYSDPQGAECEDFDTAGKEQEQVESELCHRFELVEPWRLASWLKDREMRETLLTVDVRGRDWVGGHIASSINLRTSEVVRHPESLILQCRRNNVVHIVFTCMYSVLRARKCAMAVQRAQEEEETKATGLSRIRISLLEGGMHAWMNHFARTTRGEPASSTLIDGFDPECWCDGGPSQGGLVHVMDALWSSGGQKALSDALTQELESLLVKCKTSNNGSTSASREVSRRGSQEGA